MDTWRQEAYFCVDTFSKLSLFCALLFLHSININAGLYCDCIIAWYIGRYGYVQTGSTTLNMHIPILRWNKSKKWKRASCPEPKIKRAREYSERSYTAEPLLGPSRTPESVFMWAHNCKRRRYPAYLPGTEETVIMAAVPPGRGSSIALRLSWRLRIPQMWVSRVRNLFVWGNAFALTPISNQIKKK